MSATKHNPDSKVRGFLSQDVSMTPTDWLVDCVIAAGAFGLGAIQLALSANLFVPDPFTRMILGIKSITPSPFEMLATLLTCLPLVVRRKLPWPVLIASLLLWFVFDPCMGITSLSMVSVLVALFTLAYERSNTEALVAGVAVLAVILASQLIPAPDSLGTLLLFQNAVLTAAVTFAGYAMHARQERLAAIEARALEAERTRESEASRRVEEERVRIAREIHDITAHSLSAIGIQAAVAERMVGRDDDQAESAIKQVRAISKSALEDMRNMVGLLRGSADAETAPVQGTDRLEDLVSYLADFGIDCTLDTKGYDRSLVPSHVDIALFGIAREACTNIARHSNAKHAEILLRTEEEPPHGMTCCPPPPYKAILTVTDDGVGIPEGSEHGEGHGLSGMRERAQVLGGNMFAFEAPGGGALIEVVIPIMKVPEQG